MCCDSGYRPDRLRPAERCSTSAKRRSVPCYVAGMPAGAADLAIRTAALQFIQHHCIDDGDTLTWRQLKDDCIVNGEPIMLIGASGIWKPRQLDLPISITTSPKTPYDDQITDDGLLHYAYRSQGGPDHRHNQGLRTCMEQGIPLIYLHGIAKGIYLPTAPVFVTHDDRAANMFTVAVDDPSILRPDLSPETVDIARRRYYTTVTRRRLHQAQFRDRVLAAYRKCCAICSLKHTELLEAAHIIPDLRPGGEPIVSNGIALCKIHHAAFDRHILGIRPDLVIQLRQDLLDEVDGPMLRYGLQEFHGARLLSPRRPEDQPSEEGLELRFEEFRQAG